MNRLWQNPRNFFFLFLLLNGAVWTLLPAWTCSVLPLDAAEAVAWGADFALGNSKHPPLPGWLAYGASALFGHADVGIYLLSQICVAVGLYCVYKLAREFFDERNAVAAALLATFYYYYNFESVKFNVNVPQLAFLPMTALALWHAVQGRGRIYWVYCGVFAACAMLCKYIAVLFFAALLCWMLCDRKARRSFTTSGPYLAAAAGILVLSPHLVWLYQNQFSSFGYVLSRSHEGHNSYLLILLRTVLETIAPLAAIFGADFVVRLLAGGRAALRWTVRRRDALLLGGILTLVPNALVISSALCGIKVHPQWGYQLFLYPGILICALREPLTEKGFRIFAAVCTATAVVLAGAYGVYTLTRSKDRRNLDPQKLRAYADALYRKQTGRELTMVAGEMWSCASVRRAYGYKIDACMMNNPASFAKLREKYSNGMLLICTEQEQFFDFAKEELGCDVHRRVIDYYPTFHARFGKEKSRHFMFAVIHPGEIKPKKKP